MNVEYIVVHYTASYPDQDWTAADIDKMHRAKGWNGIGYHWYIRRNGMVEKGRPESMPGAHVNVNNINKRSIGICWAGGIDRSTGPNVGVDNRTPAQTASLIKTIREVLSRYPNAKVVGHRDVDATQCPGFNVIPWWKSVSQPEVDKVELLIREYTQRLKEILTK